MLRFLNFCQNLLEKFRVLDFLAPLALRAYLVPILGTAGTKKISDIDSVIQWFGSSLGLPYPNFMAWVATLTEVGGAILLALGLAVRWVSIPLMITMAWLPGRCIWITGGWRSPKGRGSLPPSAR